MYKIQALALAALLSSCSPPGHTQCVMGRCEQPNTKQFEVEFTHEGNATYLLYRDGKVVSSTALYNPATSMWSFSQELPSGTYVFEVGAVNKAGETRTPKFEITVTPGNSAISSRWLPLPSDVRWEMKKS